MARAKQLPSGAWRVQVYDKETKTRLSFTSDTEDKANYAALEWKFEKSRKAKVGITVGDAIEKYIDSKDGVLSPTTISCYRRIRKNNLQDLMAIPVSVLTQEMVQRAINEESKRISEKTHKRMSAKSVANAHGLLSAAITTVAPEFTLRTSLPAKHKVIIELPSAQSVINAVKGTNIELPALLAMWLSFSMSEIRGIRVDAISDGYVTIKESIVQVDGIAVSKKQTKAYERTRKHKLPKRILDLIERTDAWKKGSGYIETRSGQAVSARFQRVLEKAALPHMTFHQLRHMNASIMVMLGVPDLYAMERGGWKTKSTLNRVYQHTFSAEREAVDHKMDEYFESLF